MILIDSTTFCCPASFVNANDSKTYQAIQIGNKCWIKENLNFETDNSLCFDNSLGNCNTYGRLYTWDDTKGGFSSFASPNGVQGLCSLGWHIPSDDEWKQLETHLNILQLEVDNIGWLCTNQGDQFKSTSLWYGENGNNFIGFSANSRGGRYNNIFNDLIIACYWWSQLPKMALMFLASPLLWI